MSTTTRLFGVLGHPIVHTLSPTMHNAAFNELGWDAVYKAHDVFPENLDAQLFSLGQEGYEGVNLTIPLKEVAFKLIPNLDESARLMGAINTVKFGTNGLEGYNTDGAGFLKAFEEVFGECIQGKKVFVLGTGGAGRAVALTCAQAGAASISLANRTLRRAEGVAGEISKHFPGTPVSIMSAYDDQIKKASSSDIIVQASSIGMKKGDPHLLSPEAFRPGQYVLDLIYVYPETPIMKVAREADAVVANGLGMLLHQGAQSFRIWTGIDPPQGTMKKALEQVVYVL
ncbi:MAG: shikimate dehydrogenase [Kiritimatiellae bacterium]|nr:shikimate dehydrogenase [Kiritimatiellia bacterium]